MSDVRFVRDLANRGVMNEQGEKLGRISAIAVNMESGRIAYAVLAFGAFPNRTKLFAVPWEVLTFSSHDRRFILNVPRKTLQDGLGFDTLAELSANPNFVWLAEVYEYYSDKPDWEHKRQEQTKQDVDEVQRRRAAIIPPAKQ
jgi:sporulation protein YlmC with PRC-barrel domain